MLADLNMHAVELLVADGYAGCHPAALTASERQGRMLAGRAITRQHMISMVVMWLDTQTLT